MSIFDKLQPAGAAPRAPQAQQSNPVQLMQQLRQDPGATLKGAGLSVPEGMDDPQQIVNHLINSGQVPQSRLTRAMQMMQQFTGGRAR